MAARLGRWLPGRWRRREELRPAVRARLEDLGTVRGFGTRGGPHMYVDATVICGAPRRRCATEMLYSVAHRLGRAPQKFFFFLKFFWFSLSLSHWGPHKYLWRTGRYAPQICIFLWRTVLGAPQNMLGRTPSSRWRWGPHTFCGARLAVRHR